MFDHIKAASHQWSHIVRFHLYELCTKVNSERQSRLALAKGKINS